MARRKKRGSRRRTRRTAPVISVARGRSQAAPPTRVLSSRQLRSLEVARMRNSERRVLAANKRREALPPHRRKETKSNKQGPSTCKERPTKHKGNGRSRAFIPYCSKS